MDAIVLPLHTIRLAFEDLGRRVSTALRTQVGDAARLNLHRNECLRLIATVETVSVLELELHANIMELSPAFKYHNSRGTSYHGY
jgi:hypothetical protein